MSARRLGKYVGTSPQFWLNLQTHYDLDLAEDRIAEQIEAISPLKIARVTAAEIRRCAQSSEPVTLNCYVWPVMTTSEQTGSGIRITLDTGVVVIHPMIEEVYVEIAELSGLPDGAWMVWRPGEDSCEDLA